MDLETKLSAARTRLILNQPFLGALVLRLPVEEASPRWCKTSATDARRIYYNPLYLEALSVAQVEFVLAHEALHCALSHFARRGHRDRRRWDAACDYAVNPLLLEAGLHPPPDVLYEERFAGMSAEEIYPYVPEECEEASDQHLWEGAERVEPQAGPSRGEGPQQEGPEAGAGEAAQDRGRGGAPPPPLGEEEREALALQWRQRAVGAAQQARQAGRLGGGLGRLVERLLQPRLPWRALLAHYVSAVARDDYSYARPSTRRGGEAVFPSLRSGQVRVVAALDTSGSVSPEEMARFLAELDGLKAQVRAHVVLHACDARLAPDGPWEFAPWEPLVLPRRFAGGGGTRFTPVFDWVAAQDLPPDLVIYFTDAQGEFPRREPSVPVLWVVKGSAPVPWGRRIQLN